jgi:hypothetical protein
MPASGAEGEKRVVVPAAQIVPNEAGNNGDLKAGVSFRAQEAAKQAEAPTRPRASASGVTALGRSEPI